MASLDRSDGCSNTIYHVSVRFKRCKVKNISYNKRNKWIKNVNKKHFM